MPETVATLASPAPTVWEGLADRLNPGLERPQAQSGLVASKLVTARGETYYIVKNPAAGTYVRLAPDEHYLLGLMDGRRQVKDLALAYFLEYRRFAFQRIAHLIAELRRHRFLTEDPVDAWQGLSEALARRTWLGTVDRAVSAFVSREFAVRGIDRAVSALYRAGGWFFFTRAGAALVVLLSAVGAILFARELLQTGRDPLRAGGSAGLGVLSLLAVSVITLAVHEMGHALAVKSYGRNVNRGGFMIYYGFPAFFVDTTDIWMEPRRARIVVSSGGMAACWALGGLAMLYVAARPSAALAPVAFQLAFIAFVTDSLNLYPLIELDGYFILMDWLELPLLRARAMAFVRRGLVGKLLARQPLGREERIFALFGSAAMIGSAAVLVVALHFWITTARRFFLDAWAEGHWVLQVMVALAVVTLVVPLGLGAIVKIVEGVRGARRGLVRLRHRRLAADARARLDARELISRLRFLGGLTSREREDIAGLLRLRRVRQGEYAVREGEPGDEFYLIRSGQVEVTKQHADGWSRPLVVLRRGDYFGELALLHRQPRTASVLALTDVELYALDRGAFDARLGPHLQAYGLTVQLLDERAELSRMSLFSETAPTELDPVLERLTAEEFPAGTSIIRQGEPGDRFYLIRAGRVEVVQRDAAGRDRLLSTLMAGDYFGEMALLGDVPRTATARALETVSVWSLDRTGFQDLVVGQLRLQGALSAEVERRRIRPPLGGAVVAQVGRGHNP